MQIEVRNLSERVGAEIRAEVATLLDGSEAGAILDVLEERGFICFPEIGLTDEQQIAFGRSLGGLANVTGAVAGSGGGIFKITLDAEENDMAEYVVPTVFWHMDGTYNPVPDKATMLSARRLASAGGETEFANTAAALADLPPEERAGLENLKVMHRWGTSLRPGFPNPTLEQVRRWHARPPQIHPLVWKHKSGRKSLVVGSSAAQVMDMHVDESEELLVRLCEWATQPRYVHRHAWKLGDLVIWHNTICMHRVTPYAADSGRMMHRTSIAGEPPAA